MARIGDDDFLNVNYRRCYRGQRAHDEHSRHITQASIDVFEATKHFSLPSMLLAHTPTHNHEILRRYLTQADIDAFEATRDVAATWSSRMKQTHVPIYGEEGLQSLWSAAVDVSLSLLDLCSHPRRSRDTKSCIMNAGDSL